MTQFDDLSKTCAVCEPMLPEAVDGTLSPAEQQAFERHVATCTRCSQELAEARRGAAWLSMLKTRTPEPPIGLLEKILAETSGASAASTVLATSPLPRKDAREWSVQSPGAWNRRWDAARNRLSDMFSFDAASTVFQPRLAMTAAMAFFSVALTLNLAGVRLRDLRAANFGPSGVRRTVADASASATRQFVNLRVVYQMESRVNELRNDEQH